MGIGVYNMPSRHLEGQASLSGHELRDYLVVGGGTPARDVSGQ